MADFDREAFHTYAFRKGLVMEPDKCFVYLMRSGIFIKVGIAANVEMRRYKLQMANPFEVRIERKYGVGDRHYARLAERATHEDLAEYRVHGEWFRVEFDVALEATEFFVENVRRMRKERNVALKAEYEKLWTRYLSDKAFRAKVNEIA